MEALAPTRLRWSTDRWQSIHDTLAGETGLGVWYVDLPTAALALGTVICFTFYWTEAQRWEGADLQVKVT